MKMVKKKNQKAGMSLTHLEQETLNDYLKYLTEDVLLRGNRNRKVLERIRVKLSRIMRHD